MSTITAQCSCPHPGQDSIHGAGRRAFNSTKMAFRCTVCKATLYLSKPKGTK